MMASGTCRPAVDDACQAADDPTATKPVEPRAGPQALGMINATSLENDPDTIIGLANCAATDFGAGGQANPHGTNHSVMADPVHNQIYVPIASTAFTGQSVPAICTSGGGTSTGCGIGLRRRGCPPRPSWPFR